MTMENGIEMVVGAFDFFDNNGLVFATKDSMYRGILKGDRRNSSSCFHFSCLLDKSKNMERFDIGKINQVKANKNGKEILVACDNCAMLIRVDSEAFLSLIRKHDGPVLFVDFIPHMDSFITVGADKKVYVWGPNTETPVVTITLTEIPTAFLLFENEDEFLVASSSPNPDKNAADCVDDPESLLCPVVTHWKMFPEVQMVNRINSIAPVRRMAWEISDKSFLTAETIVGVVSHCVSSGLHPVTGDKIDKKYKKKRKVVDVVVTPNKTHVIYALIGTDATGVCLHSVELPFDRYKGPPQTAEKPTYTCLAHVQGKFHSMKITKDGTQIGISFEDRALAFVDLKF